MKELIKIQAGLKAPKGQYNNFGKYSYRSCEDILEAVKPLLAANNCSLVLSDNIVNLGTRFYVQATAVFSNGKDSEMVTALAREPEIKKGMDASQITGATSSYARKYTLNGLFLIDDCKDADRGTPTQTVNMSMDKPIHRSVPSKKKKTIPQAQNDASKMDAPLPDLPF